MLQVSALCCIMQWEEEKRMKKTLIKNIGQLVTPKGWTALRGEAMGRLEIRQDAAIYMEEGRIREIGPSRELLSLADGATEVIDGEGKCAVPGFVDPHTHFLFGGSRADEFISRLEGVPYLELLRRGGGICSTMRATRQSTEPELFAQGKRVLGAMLRFGVTSLEGKSGYGLDRETELRQLRVLRRLGEEGTQTLRTTFLGAHALPPEYAGRSEAYIDFLIREMLPAVKAEGLADFCDVFCETGVFTIEESRRLLQAAAALGLKLKIHADEINSTGGAGLAARLGAVSADHLLAVSPEDIGALAASPTIAVLLPATAFCMRKAFAPGRTMIDAGCAVALASDFNPGSCCTYSIPLLLALAVVGMELTMEEALTAMTLNAAAAIGMAGELGSLEPGKAGDVLLLTEPDYRFLVYKTGINSVAHVVKNGSLIF